MLSIADQMRRIAALGTSPRRIDRRRPLREQMLEASRSVLLDLADAPPHARHFARVRLREWPAEARATVRTRMQEVSA